MDRNQYRKEWLELFKGMYVYVIMDLEGKIVYVGQTTNNYKRLADHKSKCVKATKEFMSKGNYIIQYLDVTKVVKTEQELLYLENVLIKLYEPPLNGKVNVIKDVKKQRMFKLRNVLRSVGVNWITYCRCVNGKKDKKIYLKNHPAMIA